MYDKQGLVKWAQGHLGNGYIYGDYFSSPITEARIIQKAKQYPAIYTRSYITRSQKWIGKLAGDCVGLIKSYYWSDETGTVKYARNGNKDVSANGMLALATIKGNIGSMPDIPGLAVHFPGHIGVYIGKGLVIEARGVDYGVVQTRLNDRPWTSWLQVPYVEYTDQEGDEMLKQGDKDFRVGYWQSRLIQWNGKALPGYGIDNSFGPETVTWTKNFQEAVNLTPSGSVDLVTYDAMLEILVQRRQTRIDQAISLLKKG